MRTILKCRSQCSESFLTDSSLPTSAVAHPTVERKNQRSLREQSGRDAAPSSPKS